MQPALLVRLRPLGPWRYGPSDGSSDRVDTLFRSDRLYSAVTLAMRQLGFLEEWLSATATASDPAVALSSLFPFQGDTLFAAPPATLWPPPPSLLKAPNQVFLSKIRWEAAPFVPLSLIESLTLGQPVLADQWIPDVESGCLLRRDRPNSSPFRVTQRARAAVDRVTNSSAFLHSASCVEFESVAGLWSIARFSDEGAGKVWSPRFKSALRLLADSGFGGRRSNGWGQSEEPLFQEGAWPNVLFPRLARARSNNGDSEGALYWLLSLYSPSHRDSIDWKGGDYRVTVRGGYTEGSGQKKKSLRMIAEGSVLAASGDPVGMAVDVAPEGHAHSVYRSGFALALRLPVIETGTDTGPVEGTPVEAEPEPSPVLETLAVTEPSLPEEPSVPAEPIVPEEPGAISASTAEEPAPEVESSHEI